MYGGPSYQAPQRIAPSVFRWGAIFGLVIAVLGIGNALLQSFARSMGPSGNGFGLVSCVLFFAVLGLLFEAGHMAARETGRLAAGTWAGIIAGAIPAFVLGIVVTFQVVSEQLNKNQLTNSAEAVGTAIGVLIVVAGLVLVAGAVGAGLGVLGALLGRSSYRKSHPQAAYPGYPPYGMPYPPYGANPAMPPYSGVPPSPYPPYSPQPAYPPASPYPPSDTVISQYGRVPAYPPPPPYSLDPARRDYPTADPGSGASWGAPRDGEPPRSRW